MECEQKNIFCTKTNTHSGAASTLFNQNFLAILAHCIVRRITSLLNSDQQSDVKPPLTQKTSKRSTTIV